MYVQGVTGKKKLYLLLQWLMHSISITWLQLPKIFKLNQSTTEEVIYLWPIGKKGHTEYIWKNSAGVILSKHPILLFSPMIYLHTCLYRSKYNKGTRLCIWYTEKQMHAMFTTNSEWYQNYIKWSSCKLQQEETGSPAHCLLPGTTGSIQDLPDVHRPCCIFAQLLL